MMRLMLKLLRQVNKPIKAACNQRTNSPVNAHMISEPTISTKTILVKFYIVVKVTVNSGSSFVELEYIHVQCTMPSFKSKGLLVL